MSLLPALRVITEYRSRSGEAALELAATRGQLPEEGAVVVAGAGLGFTWGATALRRGGSVP
jgi:3-oxoacyl-[acyl-carrier-protein] synthase III